jgi:hypothetical protein
MEKFSPEVQMLHRELACRGLRIGMAASLNDKRIDDVTSLKRLKPGTNYAVKTIHENVEILFYTI